MINMGNIINPIVIIFYYYSLNTQDIKLIVGIY
jgi:hypothetical protein